MFKLIFFKSPIEAGLKSCNSLEEEAWRSADHGRCRGGRGRTRSDRQDENEHREDRARIYSCRVRGTRGGGDKETRGLGRRVVGEGTAIGVQEAGKRFE